MSEPIVLNADDASRAVRAITAQVEVIRTAAVAFREDVVAEFEKSDLTFLDNIAKAMGKIEGSVRSLGDSCEDIQSALTRYIGETAEFSDDMSGFN